jgi:hypothetical protein
MKIMDRLSFRTEQNENSELATFFRQDIPRDIKLSDFGEILSKTEVKKSASPFWTAGTGEYSISKNNAPINKRSPYYYTGKITVPQKRRIGEFGIERVERHPPSIEKFLRVKSTLRTARGPDVYHNFIYVSIYDPQCDFKDYLFSIDGEIVSAGQLSETRICEEVFIDDGRASDMALISEGVMSLSERHSINGVSLSDLVDEPFFYDSKIPPKLPLSDPSVVYGANPCDVLLENRISRCLISHKIPSQEDPWYIPEMIFYARDFQGSRAFLALPIVTDL